ncbi:MAG: VOC family protein [Gammaproteobacteria bacterium]|nr:VOC family protein [Gammaproteobacteria bacterium]
MPATAMNHFTILTDDVDTTVAFYAEFLDLHPGKRPPFEFPGAWLYARDSSDAILHVIGDRSSDLLVKGVIDHMAFSARDLASAVDKLKSRGVEYELRKLPDDGTWQLFFHDPNGAKIELDFDRSESAEAA